MAGVPEMTPNSPSVFGTDYDPLDLEAVLPLSLIRSHCKIEDVPSYDDDILRLNREVAFETAEKYTGRLWSKSGLVTQTAAVPLEKILGPRMMEFVAPWSPMGMMTARPMGRPRRVKLEAPAADGFIQVFYQGQTQQLVVPPGTREVEVPFFCQSMDGCTPAVNFGVVLRYKIGICKPEMIPGGIKLGCLKLIAWNLENPGDRLEVVHDNGRASASGIIGTNNSAWASGAIEQWRQYRTSVTR